MTDAGIQVAKKFGVALLGEGLNSACAAPMKPDPE